MKWWRYIEREHIGMTTAAAAMVVVVYFFLPLAPLEYRAENDPGVSGNSFATSSPRELASIPIVPAFLPKKTPDHIETPKELRAVYMTSWVAATPSIRGRVMRLIDETEVNAVVIDVKDDTGKISFLVNDPVLMSFGAAENRVRDMKELIAALHKKGVYVIGRVAVFQDPHLVSTRPGLAVKRESDGGIWMDRKGQTWVDASSKEVWEYVVAIGKEMQRIGFDEVNYDYIRFPSDGDMRDIAFPLSGDRPPREVIAEFFAYVENAFEGSGMVTSADIFGMTTSTTFDLNIGQVLEDALAHFDYVAPMVYPSHYPPGFQGYPDPNDHPYEIVKYAMDAAVERAIAASTTPSKLRPWLQDFDYGGDYDAAEVRAQIRAVYDAGLSSWMLWDPSNVYTREALE